MVNYMYSKPIIYIYEHIDKHIDMPERILAVL